MSSLLERARAYALTQGVEVLIVEGPELNCYATARAGPLTLLVLSSGTAASPRCGDVVYRACEMIVASRALTINVHHAATRLLAS